MDTKLRRDVQFLKIYAVAITLLLAGFTLMAFTQGGRKTKFEEIDVERINLVEKDGALKLVISNKERFPDPVIDGKSYPLRQGGKTAGMLFYNDEGDECGGLSFGGQNKDGARNAGASLLFDQLNQDQTVGISYSEDDGRRTAGLNVWDRPDTPISEMVEKIQAVRKMPDGPEKTQALQKLRETSGVAQRVFVGKTRDKASALLLYDPQGRPRVLLIVDAQGQPKLEFLDEKGAVVQRLPASSPTAEEKRAKP
ncbi:MAG: hypothetical protein H0W76_10495 [Pyrinomonadaceae bacterium]|nr:hypothetical protein [Pyrinomonadaceae bacterium]